MAVIGVISAGLIFSSLTEVHSGFQLQVGLFAVLGILLSAGWALSLRLSANGNSDWVSSVTLIANILSCGALLISYSALQADRLAFMLMAQIIGMIITISVIIRRHPGIMSNLICEPSNGRKTETKVDWYLAQSIASYGGLLVLQTSSIAIAPAALSILGLIGRFVSGLNTVVTTAIVPRLIHANTQTDHAAINFIKVACFSALTIALACCGAAFLLDSRSLLPQAALVFSWFAATVFGATVKRLAIRSLEPRISWVTLVLNLVTALTVGILAVHGSLSFSLLISFYVAMDLAPALALTIPLRKKMLGVLISAPCAALVAASSALISLPQ